MKMEPKKPVNLFIPIALAVLGMFYLTAWRNIDLAPSLVVIAVGLILYFAFIQALRHREKIWFFLMLVVFLIACLFCFAFSVSANVKILPAITLLLWLIALKLLYSGDTVDSGLLKPSVEKIALLACFLVFVPTPMFLIFQIGYLPIFHFILTMIAGMAYADMAALLNLLLGFGMLLTFNAIFGFAYYVIICLMQRRAVLRIALLAVTGLMIITAVTQKVYITEGEGTDTPESTAIGLYASLLTEIKERNKKEELPPPVYLPVQRTEDAVKGPETVKPLGSSAMPRERPQQKGKGGGPGYDIEKWGNSQRE